MNKTDFILRGILKKENIRFVFADISSTVTAGIKIHDADPTAAVVLAEAMASAALLCPLLDGDEKYSIRWEYPHGRAKGLLADVAASGAVRGLIQEPHLMEADSPDEIYGKDAGFVTIIKSESGKILNSGKTRATLGSAAADAALFFSISDQLETEISVATSFNPDPRHPVKSCRGMLLQAMPDCDLKQLETYRNRMHTLEFQKLLLQAMPLEKQLWALLAYISGHDNITAIHENISYEFAPSPEFKCSCSRKKMKQAMLTLGKAELKEIFATNNNSPKITCQFCRKQYQFQKEDFKDLV